jgi:uncharacterized protein YndB with AHSA1/START domain
VPTVQESTEIKAPIGDVFAAVTDPHRAGEWSPRVVEISEVSPYPPREGTTWRQTAGLAGQTATMTCRIVRFDPPREGVLEIVGGDLGGRLTTRCQDVAGRTRVDQVLEFNVPGGIKGRMMSAAAGPMLHREMSHALARLRETLEREAGGGHGPGSP